MKRIISCSDGTWNEPSASEQGMKLSVTDGGKKVKVANGNNNENTNVIKMYNAICAEGRDRTGQPARQVKIYDEGVGTGYSWRERVGGGISGAGLDKNIKDVYRFFVLNYHPGDELYLFGFSRGAYTARSLGGFIRNSGILKPEYLHLVDKAYELYRDRNVYSHPESDLMRSFRAAYAFEDITPVHFIGVWDTVGALGIPVPWLKASNSKRYRFHDCTLSSYVRHAYHALAVDEKRTLFSPTLWEQSKTANKEGGPEQKLEQRWFAGVHSNVGGGYPDCGLSNISLQWVMDKAEEAGLCYNEKPLITERPDRDLGNVINSYTPMYWLWPPKWREIKLGEGNQTIDDSVWKKWDDKNKTYRPRNLQELAKQR